MSINRISELEQHLKQSEMGRMMLVEMLGKKADQYVAERQYSRRLESGLKDIAELAETNGAAYAKQRAIRALSNTP